MNVDFLSFLGFSHTRRLVAYIANRLSPVAGAAASGGMSKGMGVSKQCELVGATGGEIHAEAEIRKDTSWDSDVRFSAFDLRLCFPSLLHKELRLEGLKSVDVSK
mmetsp:Transcript_15537/g.21839  ORF Transcript_15537/g.21839 Transcript_15537/m.21839 type:complete len:105 (+) Transcript_15537:22-336(+)